MIYISSVQCFLETILPVITKKDLIESICVSPIACGISTRNPFFDVGEVSILNIPTHIIASRDGLEVHEKELEYSEYLREEQCVRAFYELLIHSISLSKDVLMIHIGKNRLKGGVDRIDVLSKHISSFFRVDPIDLDKNIDLWKNLDRYESLIAKFNKQIAGVSNMLEWVGLKIVVHGIWAKTQFVTSIDDILHGRDKSIDHSSMKEFLKEYGVDDPHKLNSHKSVKKTFMNIMSEFRNQPNEYAAIEVSRPSMLSTLIPDYWELQDYKKS